MKEEPDTGHDIMETTPVALPPTSVGMGGHTSPGSGGPHVGGPPMQAGMPLTPVTPTSLQPPPHHRIEIDPNFEPVARSRSNTWPLPCPEGYMEGEEPVAVATEGPVPVDQPRPPGAVGPGDPPGGPPKKNTSRRNPWGNMSYADLIAQAIMSSPDGRATLSQIYDWMVQNVPYFKDKGDSNSSAGWKVGSSSSSVADTRAVFRSVAAAAASCILCRTPRASYPCGPPWDTFVLFTLLYTSALFGEFQNYIEFM